MSDDLQNLVNNANRRTAQKNAALKITSADIRAALSIKYPAQSHALMWEVSHAGNQTRYADAVAVGLWQSHGNEIEGIEIKVSRGDWLNELKQPDKSQGVFQYCHRFWLVTPKDLVKTDELPSTWGLMEFTGEQLRIKVKAPKLKPSAVTPGFLAAMLRRSAGKDEEMSAKIIDREVRERVSKAEQSINERVEREIASRVKHAEEAMVKFKAIKQSTGIELDNYTPSEDWIKAIKYLTDKSYANHFRAENLRILKHDLLNVIKSIEAMPKLD